MNERGHVRTARTAATRDAARPTQGECALYCEEAPTPARYPAHRSAHGSPRPRAYTTKNGCVYGIVRYSRRAGTGDAPTNGNLRTERTAATRDAARPTQSARALYCEETPAPAHSPDRPVLTAAARAHTPRAGGVRES